MTQPSQPGRREDHRLLTGRARYTANHPTPDALWVGFVRSVNPHGRLRAVDLRGCLASPGIVAAFDAAGLALDDIPSATGAGPHLAPMTRPVLARDKVRYVGEPVAVIVGESDRAVADAIAEAVVEVDPLPPVTTTQEAMADGSLLFEDAGTNTLHHRWHGSAAPGPLPIEVTVDVEVPRLAAAPLEPLVMIAEPDAPSEGVVTLRVGHQTPHRLRNVVAKLLGWQPERLRVVVGDVGGGFGLRGMIEPEHVVVTALARELGRTVRFEQTRMEQLQGGPHGRGQRQRITLRGQADGRVEAMEAVIVGDVGAYPHNGSAMPITTSELINGAYDIPAVAVDLQIVVSNRAPTGAYRGAGRPEATFGIERAMDAFARAVGLDPADVRRRNAVPRSAMPFRTATGQTYDSGDYVGALDRALDMVDAPAVRREQARRRDAGGWPLGLGIGLFVERSGSRGGIGEHATLSLDRSGRVTVDVGSQSTGQGHETVWAEIAAGRLGLPPGRVTVRMGDTDDSPEGIGTFGSRSAQTAGSIVAELGEALAARIRDEAAHVLEAAVEDLRIAADGTVGVRGDPTSGIPLGQLAATVEERGDRLSVRGVNDMGPTFPYGAHLAVVEVDPETGRVHVQRLVAVDDCGRVLHEPIVEGQVAGSVAQGIAAALFEEVVYDDDGQPQTSTFIDYTLPSAPDLAMVLDTGRLEHPAPGNPLGVKGIGESGCIGMPPAIVNAVLDALVPFGVEDLRLPMTPYRVWQALQKPRAGS